MEITALPPHVLAIACAVTFFAALVQGTIGFAFAVVSVPILLTLDPRLAPMPQLIVQVPLTLMVLYREREHAQLRAALYITIGRFPGTIVGGVVLAMLGSRLIDAVVGGLTLIAVLILAGGRSIPLRPATELVAGFVSGFAQYLSAIGGPPIALLYKSEKGPTVRASLALVFFIGLLITLAWRTYRGDYARLDLELGALLLVPTLIGTWSSRFLLGRVEGRPLRVSILLLSAFAAIGLIGRAVIGDI